MSEVTKRVARNTAIRAAAELVGKFATLALMAALARKEGAAALGLFVFALAWSELASTPIDMGFDRHFLRLVARDKAQMAGAFYNVLALKLARAIPLVAISWTLVWALGYEGEERATVYLLTVTYLLESVRWTLFSIFTGHERADLIGRVLVTQRLLSGSVGLVAVLLGYGIVGVAVVYVVAAAVAVALGFWLLRGSIGIPPFALPEGPRAELRRQSLAFGAQEVLSAGIARVDAVLLAVIATSTVVGLYGAAYRLLEATIFLSTALLGAFTAMFAYLDEHSEPTIQAVFSRALKLSYLLLLPCAIPLAVLPGPILELFFGDEFGPGADALRLLAPTVVVLGNVLLTGSLIASRLDPKVLLRCFIVAFAVNLVVNLALIPPLGAAGAALGMLLTEIVLAVIMLRLATRAVGRPPLLESFGAASIAGAAMALVMLPVDAHPIPCLLYTSPSPRDS